MARARWIRMAALALALGIATAMVACGGSGNPQNAAAQSTWDVGQWDVAPWGP